jgi:hypothetical protein
MDVAPSDVANIDPRLLRFVSRWCAEVADLAGPEVGPLAPLWSRFGLAVGRVALELDPGPSPLPAEDEAFRLAMASMTERLLEDPACR